MTIQNEVNELKDVQDYKEMADKEARVSRNLVTNIKVKSIGALLHRFSAFQGISVKQYRELKKGEIITVSSKVLEKNKHIIEEVK